MIPNDEKETTCVYDYVTKEWSVYSSVPTHITQLLKRSGPPYWKEEVPSENGTMRIVAGKWKLQHSQVRLAGIRRNK